MDTHVPPDVGLLLIMVHSFSTKSRKQPSANFAIFVLVFAVFLKDVAENVKKAFIRGLI
jgi:hypothetical protein